MGKKLDSFQQALEIMENRVYEEATYNTQNIILKEDNTVEIAGSTYEYEPHFISSIFKITKLPLSNSNILPPTNVINDLNTLLNTLSTDVKIRFLNSKAYTLFPSNNKGGIKIPLNYKEFLDLVQTKIDIDDALIYESENFLRVISFYPDTYFIYEDEDQGISEKWNLGIDIIMGEVFKSPPITINLILKNNEKQFIMPFFDKPIKIMPKLNKDKIRIEFDKRMDSINIDQNLIQERFNKIYNKQLNDELVRVLFSSSKFLPIGSKNSIFADFFKLDENHKLTTIVNKEAVKDKQLKDLIDAILQQVGVEGELFMSNENVYKADFTIGSMFTENNKKFNNALLV